MINFHLRMYLILSVMMIGFITLICRLWDLQINLHEIYALRVPASKDLKARIPGSRGDIKDRNGLTLATNTSFSQILINLAEVEAEYKRSHLKKGETPPKFTYQVTEQGQIREKSESDIYIMFEKVIISKLSELGLARPYNSENLRIHYRSYANVIPWVYCDGITSEERAQFAENNISLPGLEIAERATRIYPYDALACHVLGYVRLPDDQRTNKEDRIGWDFYLPDDFGGDSVEKAFDVYLRGKPGTRTLKKDERGRFVGRSTIEAPRRGNDVYLTLDARMQMIAERALIEGGIGRGAVVLLNPNNGDVLAMASIPNYNPNQFIPSVSEEDWDTLLKDDTKPLLNRTITSFAPGSTYKIPIALAGCLANIQNRSYNCSGSVLYGNNNMKCWIAEKGGSHGTLNLSDAIMRSCNCFFFQYGNDARIDRIVQTGDILLLGKKTGIELFGENPGILPSPTWLKTNRPAERWSSGYTANTSIGQGLVLASPLQMALSAASVATGKVYRPHLLHKVMDQDKIIEQYLPQTTANLLSLFSSKELEVVRKGMWKVVNADSGTAKAARIPNVEVAGKTGTAQNWRRNHNNLKVQDNHTLFISFAPYENPKYACCILVQGGKSGGGCAAPIARRILEQCLALEQGYEIAIAPTPVVSGHFRFIESVSYPEFVNPASVEEDEDHGQENNQTPDEDSLKTIALTDSQRTNSPNIRRKADAAGSSSANSNKKILKAIPVAVPVKPNTSKNRN
jgi:penicillin-binding protein 2